MNTHLHADHTDTHTAPPPSLVYASDQPAREGTSRLVALPYRNGGTVRGYVDGLGGAWFIIVDLFHVLAQGSHGNIRRRIKSPGAVVLARAWVANAASPSGGGFALIQSLSESGMVEMLGVSRQAPSIELLDWSRTIAAPALRTAQR